MVTNWMIYAGIVIAVAGFFAAAWFRYSRPVRFVNGKSRVAPQLQATQDEAPSASIDLSRRAPSL